MPGGGSKEELPAQPDGQAQEEEHWRLPEGGKNLPKFININKTTEKKKLHTVGNMHNAMILCYRLPSYKNS